MYFDDEATTTGDAPVATPADDKAAAPAEGEKTEEAPATEETPAA